MPSRVVVPVKYTKYTGVSSPWLHSLHCALLGGRRATGEPLDGWEALDTELLSDGAMGIGVHLHAAEQARGVNACCRQPCRHTYTRSLLLARRNIGRYRVRASYMQPCGRCFCTYYKVCNYSATAACMPVVDVEHAMIRVWTKRKRNAYVRANLGRPAVSHDHAAVQHTLAITTRLFRAGSL